MKVGHNISKNMDLLLFSLLSTKRKFRRSRISFGNGFNLLEVESREMIPNLGLIVIGQEVDLWDFFVLMEDVTQKLLGLFEPILKYSKLSQQFGRQNS